MPTKVKIGRKTESRNQSDARDLIIFIFGQRSQRFRRDDDADICRIERGNAFGNQCGDVVFADIKRFRLVIYQNRSGRRIRV